MSNELSPRIEQLIAQAVLGGLYPSRESLLEEAAERLLDEQIAPVPAEHLDAVEQGLAALDAGRTQPWTKADVDEILRRGRERFNNRE